MAQDSDKAKFNAKVQFASQFYSDVQQLNHFVTSYQVLYNKVSPQAKRAETDNVSIDENDEQQLKNTTENVQYYTVKINQTIPSIVALFKLNNTEKTLKKHLKNIEDQYKIISQNYLIDPNTIRDFLTAVNLFLVDYVLIQLNQEEQNDFANAFNS